jgi:choline/glycine/proline betaine transport protein
MLETENEPAAHKTRRISVNPPVFFVAAGLVLAFAVAGVALPGQVRAIFGTIQAFMIRDFGWLYIAVVAGFLIFTMFLMLSRYGDIRLGPDDSEPDYSYMSWFAMLFSAGMGIGLLFFGVAEPLQHFASPPVGEGRTIESARQAMVLTFFHWGLHAWAIYIVVGLALAYFAFRRGLPLTIRSALYPLIGDRIYGPIGHAIDIFAVLGTMFGVATSLGLGVLQANAGLSYLFGLAVETPVQLALIAAITSLATISVVLGLDRGIKRLSELNILLALSLLIFVLFTGSTIFLLQAFVQNVGAYLGDLVQRTFRLYAYEPNPWIADWTLFYWGWWISWSPFVGMFIARISRGRTIREFIAGVSLVPVLFTFLWMTVLGNTAIAMDLGGVAALSGTVANNLPIALFEMLSQLPFATVTSVLSTLLIVTFFVTSADSGALIVDMITSSGAENPPVWQRVFWAVSAGAIAAALLVAGGLEALQTAAIASALPFAIVMIFICYGLLRAVQLEAKGQLLNLGSHANLGTDVGLSWQQRLANIIGSYDESEATKYIKDVVQPALQAVAEQLREAGLSPVVLAENWSADLSLEEGEQRSFQYRLRARGFSSPTFAWTAGRASSERRSYRIVVATANEDYDVTGYTKNQLINDLLRQLAAHRHRSLRASERSRAQSAEAVHQKDR